MIDENRWRLDGYTEQIGAINGHIQTKYPFLILFTFSMSQSENENSWL